MNTSNIIATACVIGAGWVVVIAILGAEATAAIRRRLDALEAAEDRCCPFCDFDTPPSLADQVLAHLYLPEGEQLP